MCVCLCGIRLLVYTFSLPFMGHLRCRQQRGGNCVGLLVFITIIRRPYPEQEGVDQQEEFLDIRTNIHGCCEHHTRKLCNLRMSKEITFPILFKRKLNILIVILPRRFYDIQVFISYIYIYISQSLIVYILKKLIDQIISQVVC